MKLHISQNKYNYISLYYIIPIILSNSTHPTFYSNQHCEDQDFRLLTFCVLLSPIPWMHSLVVWFVVLLRVSYYLDVPFYRMVVVARHHNLLHKILRIPNSYYSSRDLLVPKLSLEWHLDMENIVPLKVSSS